MAGEPPRTDGLQKDWWFWGYMGVAYVEKFSDDFAMESFVAADHPPSLRVPKVLHHETAPEAQASDW